MPYPSRQRPLPQLQQNIEPQPRGGDNTRVIKTLWPGQAGTVKLLRTHGDSLVCVRYRRDKTGQRRYKTVEIIIETRLSKSTMKDAAWYAVAIPNAMTLALVRKQGARYDPADKSWYLRGSSIQALGMELLTCAPRRQRFK